MGQIFLAILVRFLTLEPKDYPSRADCIAAMRSGQRFYIYMDFAGCHAPTGGRLDAAASAMAELNENAGTEKVCLQGNDGFPWRLCCLMSDPGLA